MPRIDQFRVTLRTGAQGRSDIPDFVINGFQVKLDGIEGGCGPGQTLIATGAPRSFAHSLLLRGPAEGTWVVEGFQVTYVMGPEDSYQLTFGAATVDADADLSIFEDKPLPFMEV